MFYRSLWVLIYFFFIYFEIWSYCVALAGFKLHRSSCPPSIWSVWLIRGLGRGGLRGPSLSLAERVSQCCDLNHMLATVEVLTHCSHRRPEAQEFKGRP